MQYYTAQYVPVIGKLLAKSDFIWRYERQILHKYDLSHVATRSKKELLIDHKFKEPIICLTNGVHDLYFTDVKQNGIREKYRLGDKKVLLYASRLSPEKYPLNVIKAFKEIHKEVPHSRLILVGGDGPSTNAVKSSIKRWHMEDFVSYEGRVPFIDLLKLYNTADVSCLWSWIEAEGLVLIEAMAQGTPTVGANACGIKDVIRHGETGYLANNLTEFKDYIVKLFKDDGLRDQLGENAKKVAENYKVSKVAQTWIKLYKLAIDQLFPLRYYERDRKERVELVKEFIHHLPNVSF
jgi:glycosyltransferase involved in cell wall biosynthesis